MYNILVVDDDKEIVKAIEIYLEKENYFIYKAYDGEEALKQINDNVINLIIMDIMMPKMDGYTATREIRTLKDTKKANVPIIAMTANAFDEDRKKAIKAGMNGHIAKPIDVNVILQNLDRIFGKNGDEDTRAKEQ